MARRLLVSLLLAPALGRAAVHYRVVPEPSGGSLAVSVTIDDARPTETFRIPAWTPGFYTLLQFQRKISDVRATSGSGARLTVTQPDPRAWRVTGGKGGPITLGYRVLGDSPGLGIFATNVQSNSAFVMGTSAFLYADGRKAEPVEVRLRLPSGWDVATALERDPSGFYKASDYDELADSPIQLGRMVRRPFSVEGEPFEAVFVTRPGEVPAPNVAEEVETMRRVSAPILRLFGSAPFQRYVYIVHLAPGGFLGGLEHRSSTVLAVPNASGMDLDDLYAHEFFHTWNVKQIRPSVLGPFDYAAPARTGNLWFAEGVTDYYAKLAVYRSGVEDRSWLLDQIESQVTTYQRGKTRLTKTVEEASRASWENGGFNLGDLDYYNKGLLAGLIFDAAIRARTDGRKSLDDVMRLLYARYRLPNAGYPEDGILQAINEVAGADLTPLYNRMIRSTEELPYSELAGIGLTLAEPGKPFSAPNFTIEEGRVASVGASAQAAGLRPGDEVLAAAAPAAGSVRLRIRRAGQEMAIDVPAPTRTLDRYQLTMDPIASPSAAKLRKEWFAR